MGILLRMMRMLGDDGASCCWLLYMNSDQFKYHLSCAKSTDSKEERTSGLYFAGVWEGAPLSWLGACPSSRVFSVPRRPPAQSRPSHCPPRRPFFLRRR